MAEKTNEADPQTKTQNTEEARQQDNLPENKVAVEEVGTLKKKVIVTIARERIDAKRDEMFGELSNTAQVPGFRIGRAPRRLLEKRFGKEVAQDVRNAMIGESIGDAVEKSELKTIGEPDLDLEKIEIPESGDLEFSFEVEVAPEFDLPQQKGIEVERRIIKLTDERIDEELKQWAEMQARYEETDDPAAEGDAVIAGATIRIEGEDALHDRPGLTLRVAPGQIEGIPLVDLPKALVGKKADQTAKLKIKVPEAHPNEQWRGKEANIEVHISRVRRRIVPEVKDEFAKMSGFESLGELREYVRGRIESRVEFEVRRGMRGQVERYLLDNTDFDLPEGVVRRHTARVAQRRTVDLLQRGIPRERIEEHITELRAAATEEARRDLKLQFILDKIAEQRGVQVSPDEVNARIAQMAEAYKRRPERVRQELAADGSLNQLEVIIRQEKTVDALLQDAKITEVKEGKPEKKPAPKKTEKKTTRKTAKKTTKKTTRKSAGKTEEKTTKKAVKKTQKKTEKKSAARKASKKSGK